MIGVLMFLNARGDVVLSRQFRDGYSIRMLADIFRDELISTQKVDRCPVNAVNAYCFIHLKLSDMFLVMVSSNNVNCLACMQYGVRLLQLIHGYYKTIDETVLKENFVALQQIIDETADLGYPHVTDLEALKQFIPEGGIDCAVTKDSKESQCVTQKLMGDVPWRTEGLIYSVNEMFVDVVENVNMLVSNTGEILHSDILGKVVVNNFLSGMPECELMLNARAYGEARIDAERDAEDGSEIKLGDVSFHKCVRLGKFDEPQSIRFVPPDGEFTLMKYHSDISVQPPVIITEACVEELSKTRMTVMFNLKCGFPEGQAVTDVKVTIGCPENTACATVKVGKGKAKYKNTECVITWDISKIYAGEEVAFFAEVKQIAPTLGTTETTWSMPSACVQFTCISHSLTGMKITELKLHEPVFLYTPCKWIRYVTQAGQYQCRL